MLVSVSNAKPDLKPHPEGVSCNVQWQRQGRCLNRHTAAAIVELSCAYLWRVSFTTGVSRVVTVRHWCGKVLCPFDLD